MINLICNYGGIGYIYKDGNWNELDVLVHDFLSNLCLTNGASFNGHLNASKKLLPNNRKLPIYIAYIDDYLIPLSSPFAKNCIWFSARNYLTCYQQDNRNFIKFKDRTCCEVFSSIFTIKQQYAKYVKLNNKILELKQDNEL